MGNTAAKIEVGKIISSGDADGVGNLFNSEPEAHMRLLAVGDIHGYLQNLQKLIRMVAPTNADQVVFLGDYVDRGPDSPGVIQYLIDFAKSFPKTIFIGGNHDHLLVSMLQARGFLPLPEDNDVRAYWGVQSYETIKNIPPFTYNFRNVFSECGGMTTINQYGGFDNVPTDHANFLAKCRLYYEQEIDNQKYFFVHAGVYPGIPLASQRAEDLLWIREEFFSYPRSAGSETDFGFGHKVIVHGHHPYVPFSANSTYRINVDSGVYLSGTEFSGLGKLSCCDVLARKYWQV